MNEIKKDISKDQIAKKINDCKEFKNDDSLKEKMVSNIFGNITESDFAQEGAKWLHIIGNFWICSDCGSITQFDVYEDPLRCESCEAYMINWRDPLARINSKWADV